MVKLTHFYLRLVTDEANNAWVEQLGNIQLQITNLLRNAPVSLTLEICAVR